MTAVLVAFMVVFAQMGANTEISDSGLSRVIPGNRNSADYGKSETLLKIVLNPQQGL